MGDSGRVLERGAGFRALLLDDDEYALDYLEAVLAERYPGLEVEKRLKPDPAGAFDLYFLDDDFEGVRLAGDLARKIRATHPDAVILAFSASLDLSTLKDLLNAGCNGVCDKKVPSDMPEMLGSLDRALEDLVDLRGRPPEGLSGRYLLQTLRVLFREWNARLENQS